MLYIRLLKIMIVLFVHMFDVFKKISFNH